jgi:CRISPR/Cas system CMR-associated protein Cmr1 (group 7 of RAMP superfamily)
MEIFIYLVHNKLHLTINLYGIYRNSGEMSTRDLQKMVQALPQYSEQIDKLSLHVEVSFVVMLSWHKQLFFSYNDNTIWFAQIHLLSTFFSEGKILL